MVIGCAIEVHRTYGAGLPGNTYEKCLAYEFSVKNVPFIIQAPIAILYKDIKVSTINSKVITYFVVTHNSMQNDRRLVIVILAGRRVSSAMDGDVHIPVTGFRQSMPE